MKTALTVVASVVATLAVVEMVNRPSSAKPFNAQVVGPAKAIRGGEAIPEGEIVIERTDDAPAVLDTEAKPVEPAALDLSTEDAYIDAVIEGDPTYANYQQEIYAIDQRIRELSSVGKEHKSPELKRLSVLRHDVQRAMTKYRAGAERQLRQLYRLNSDPMKDGGSEDAEAQNELFPGKIINVHVEGREGVQRLRHAGIRKLNGRTFLVGHQADDKYFPAGVAIDWESVLIIKTYPDQQDERIVSPRPNSP